MASETPERSVPRATALCVVCESYADERTFPRLAGAREQMEEIAGRLEELGFEVRVVGGGDPGRDDFDQAVEEWSEGWRREGGRGPALILWSGHGVLVDEELRLALSDLVPGDHPGTRTARIRRKGVSVEELVDYAVSSEADQILVLVDTCYSGDGAGQSVRTALKHWSEVSLPPGRTKWLGFMASCQRNETSAGDGPLFQALTRVLREGPRTDAYLSAWSAHNELVTGAELLAALPTRWEGDGQRPVRAAVGDESRAFPNPLARPGAPAALVEHLVLAARGVGHREEGWFFTGRRRVLGRIVAWMDEGTPGLFLVTGPAGSGKSAVLGRIATLADPEQRAEAERQGSLREGDPDPGVRDRRSFTAVHLRGLNALQAAGELAGRLGLREPRSVDDFRAELRELPGLPVIVLDGLDEVPSEHTQAVIEDLVFPLSRMTPVLVGSRRRPFRNKLAEGESLPDALVRHVGAGVVTVDLEQEPDTRDDIAGYVRRRCEAAGVDGSAVAEALAKRATEADGGFLFARLVTGFLIARLREGVVGASDLLAGLPESVAAAFEEDLRSGPVRVRDDGTRLPSAARDLLTALAWAAGPGMPAGGVWEAVASGLGAAVYDEADVDWVLSAYGRYIVEDGAGPQAVYRLYHREFVSHLRRRDGSVALTVLGTVVELVRRDARPGDWGSLDPYVVAWLGQHAVWAGERGIDVLREVVAWDEHALPHLAVSLHDLGALLSARGDHRAALTAIAEATDLYATLAANGDFRAAFATSLASRAAMLSMTGDDRAALGDLREAVRIRRALARDDPQVHRSDLAGSLNDLGTVLARTGERRAGLAAAVEAVGIQRELADADPAAHLSSLAISLNNLANHLSHNGDAQAALDTARQALRINARLARTHPAAHLPSLAISLNNLAGFLADNGDLRAALRPAREAVRIRRSLAAANPAAHLGDLAASLTNLATRLADNGEHEAALEAAQEAAALGARLMDANRAVHLPLHASVLHNLAVRLGENGNHRAALDRAAEALRIERELAAANPPAHLEKVAVSLNNIATRLAQNGEARAALEAAEECVDIRRELAATDRAAHLPGLAAALNNLANHRARTGDRQAALEHTEECVDIRRELAATHRAAHLPGLAAALNNLANHLAHAEEPEAALDAAREAVRIRRELAAAHPAAHLPSLAGSLSTLATRLAEKGEHEAALSTAREAVGIYDGLSPSAQAVRLPDRALAVSNLAGHLARTKDHKAALSTAREAVLLYDRLARANPAAHRPHLAWALTNLGDRLADVGEHRAALEPAREALRIRRELAGDDPAAYFSDLLTSLRALAGHLAGCGEEEQAVRIFTDATRTLVRDHPPAGRAVACERGRFQLRRPDRASREAGLRTLLRILRDGTAAQPDEIDIRIRHGLRSFTRDAPDHLALFEQVWRETASARLPGWLDLSDDVLDLVAAWLTTPDWTESHAFWRRHADVLGSDEALTALTEYALVDPGVREHIALRERIRTRGATAAFRPLECEDRLLDWLDLAPGDDSRRFLHDHAGLLLDEAAMAGLEEFGLPAYTALLHFARTDGIDAAYDRVQDRTALQRYVEQAVAEGNGEALAHASAVERGFLEDALPALVHAQAAALLAGDLEALAPGALAGAAADADPATRTRLTSELAALSARHGGRHMSQWISLIQALNQAA